ncbi:hypothetical protein [Microbacterium capsulatum]|uniref:Lipoprotein n=1 Tax=Microbacterium capsulatum TaxID=3041921 RepID=A0ABU0XJE2_9MICO|nr:hypothetical protein [Microbacterium sp. ASV81]MDQ4214713.1 hypothetical protein [Microbacterium sp. ASV81]
MIRRPTLAALTLAAALGLTACATGAVAPGSSSAPSRPDTQSAADACAAVTAVLTTVGQDVASIDPTAAAKDPNGTMARVTADVDKVRTAVDGLGNGEIRTAALKVQGVYEKYGDTLTRAVQDHDPSAAFALLQAPKDLADATQGLSRVCAAK